MTKELFLSRLSDTQKENYDYVLVHDEFNSNNKIKIICKKHGIFEQDAQKFMNNGRCRSCYIESKIKTNEQFILDAQKIHGEKYDYSLVKYKDAKNKIKIICKKHGIFEQSPNNHLTGYGCRTCFDDEHRLTKNDFIENARKIHGDVYDYSKVKYIDSETKVIIICKEHGEFEQKPRSHTSGDGCPECRIKKIRLSFINKTNSRLKNGYQVTPNFNTNGCAILDNIAKEKCTHIQHAMNGGEFYISELGYWLDGYDKENNIAYEIDEQYHFRNKNISKDLKRENEIKQFLKCEFIRIRV